MKKLKTAVPILAWLTCGFLAWGIDLAHHCREYDSYRIRSLDCRSEQPFAAIWGLAGGPISLIATYMFSGGARDGLKWTCRPDEIVGDTK